MKKLVVDLGKTVGTVKPMHAVNNGPVYKFKEDQRITNIDYFREAGIPYARNHDAAHSEVYGGEHTVDVHAIFPNFDADPYDENSYDFVCTDEYLRVIDYADVKTFYRLGSKIEHGPKKYGTLPPKDFNKWAVICEHIIKHYNYGWANGFHYGLEYWEIWNEPDLDSDDSDNKRNWGGPKAQFFDLFEIAAKHLKMCFPELKIGGPGLGGQWAWGEEFLREMKKRDVPLDFLSWHCYTSEVSKFKMFVEHWRNALDNAGYTESESILDEWNYVCGWTDEKWVESIKTMKNYKGAAFVAGAMEECQNLGLDLMIYYYARPCAMNGMFDTALVCNRLKAYYPFYMFNQLYKLKTAVEAKSLSENLYGCAASDGTDSAIMLTYYNDNDNSSADIEVEIINPNNENGAELEFYLLDEDNDNLLIRKEVFNSKKQSSILTLKMYSTVLIKIKNL
ncbi:MAG: hypothetical protein J5662_07460 [Clostridia bacterium]|nr:hypothetical protein [Clostridia bacterium]